MIRPGTPSKNSNARRCASRVDLRRHPLEHLHEHRVRVGQRHHKKRQLPQLAVDVHQGVAEIDLSLTGAMNQRYKDLLALLLDLPHRFGHLRVAAGVAFLLDPLEDPLGRMPLLPGNATVVFQDLPEASPTADRRGRNKVGRGSQTRNGPIFGLLKGTSRR
ncbi:MAG: hypothetical protein IH899_02020 [Planctomycetes bacterium]|nr:hypothetical protein [Planctomycetota bacterium]